MHDLYDCFDEAFKTWWFGNFLFPLCTAVITGVLAANITLYRELQQRAFDEMQFISRRIFLGGTSSSDWGGRLGNFGYEMEQITRRMDHNGFTDLSTIIGKEILTLTCEFRKYYDEADRLAKLRCGESIRLDEYERVFDQEMRLQWRTYLKDNSVRMCFLIFKHRPNALDLLEIHNFRGFSKIAKTARRIFQPSRPRCYSCGKRT